MREARPAQGEWRVAEAEDHCHGRQYWKSNKVYPMEPGPRDAIVKRSEISEDWRRDWRNHAKRSMVYASVFEILGCGTLAAMFAVARGSIRWPCRPRLGHLGGPDAKGAPRTPSADARRCRDPARRWSDCPSGSRRPGSAPCWPRSPAAPDGRPLRVLVPVRGRAVTQSSRMGARRHTSGLLATHREVCVPETRSAPYRPWVVPDSAPEAIPPCLPTDLPLDSPTSPEARIDWLASPGYSFSRGARHMSENTAGGFDPVHAVGGVTVPLTVPTAPEPDRVLEPLKQPGIVAGRRWVVDATGRRAVRLASHLISLTMGSDNRWPATCYRGTISAAIWTVDFHVRLYQR